MMRKIFVLSVIVLSLWANAQRAVSKIYSDFNGFWESSSAIQPNNNHSLLGFIWDADGSGTVHSPVTYSTGQPAVRQMIPFPVIPGLQWLTLQKLWLM